MKKILVSLLVLICVPVFAMDESPEKKHIYLTPDCPSLHFPRLSIPDYGVLPQVSSTTWRVDYVCMPYVCAPFKETLWKGEYGIYLVSSDPVVQTLKPGSPGVIAYGIKGRDAAKRIAQDLVLKGVCLEIGEVPRYNP